MSSQAVGLGILVATTVGLPTSICAQAEALRSTQLYECRVAAGPGVEVDALRVELQPAGDFDGDDHDDLLVMLWRRSPESSWLRDCWNAEVEVRSGLDGSSLWHWPGPSNKACALAASRAGDIDRDGREDLILTVVSTEHETVTRVGIVAGGDGHVIRAFEADFESWVAPFQNCLPHCFGSVLGPMGDVNSDGVPDYFVGGPDQTLLSRAQGNAGHPTLLGRPYRNQPGDGVLDVYSGQSGARLWRQSRIHFDHGFAASAAVVADVDGDDAPDLVVGAPPSLIALLTQDISGVPGRSARAGCVYTLSGRDGDVLAYRDGRTKTEGLGRAIIPVGDVDGDGGPDVVVGASRYGDSALTYQVVRLSDGEVLRTLDPRRLGPKGCWGTLRSAGDLDGDGRTELVEFADPLFSPSSPKCRPEVHVVDPRTGESRIGLSGDFGTRFGCAAGSAGDADGDGRDELAVCEGLTANGDRAEVLIGVYKLSKPRR